MIRTTSHPTSARTVKGHGHAEGFTFSLECGFRVPDWIQVDVTESDVRRLVGEFLMAKFRPVLCEEDSRLTRTTCLLWLRDVLTHECGLPPTVGADSPVIVEPAPNTELNFDV